MRSGRPLQPPSSREASTARKAPPACHASLRTAGREEGGTGAGAGLGAADAAGEVCRLAAAGDEGGEEAGGEAAADEEAEWNVMARISFQRAVMGARDWVALPVIVCYHELIDLNNEWY
ncbi:hypothetical protein [Paenibacillus caseinilyticus]|uniref:hypothetical protein n=1 Tax=Paenibacillus caseinilyticus TaxID=3098138 RepID=UPI0022B8B3D1|nr:hypothetical protein [Paenibacillus caseinilyticus]MCZ8523514.1 hypothetical protein [Paenibacillus caseinilyticus]